MGSNKSHKASQTERQNTRHLVQPDLLPALDEMPAFRFTYESLLKLRAARDEALQVAGPVDGVEVREVQIPGAPGDPEVRVVVYQPTQHRGGALLHVHGGGYVMGSPEMSDLANKLTARDLGCTVASVDYRLAPETPHPGPVEDCYAGLAWLHQSADALGVDRNRIAIKGESAGGGLAAGLALLARDRGEYAICHQHLTYPMTDDRTPDAPHPYVGEFVWTPESNQFGWQSLLGDSYGTDNVSIYAAASRADDLNDLPSTFIATAALDLFLEENLEYARRLTRAGVPMELHVYPGAYHGFQANLKAVATRQYVEDSRRALAMALNGAP